VRFEEGQGKERVHLFVSVYFFSGRPVDLQLHWDEGVKQGVGKEHGVIFPLVLRTDKHTRTPTRTHTHTHTHAHTLSFSLSLSLSSSDRQHELFLLWRFLDPGPEARFLQRSEPLLLHCLVRTRRHLGVAVHELAVRRAERVDPRLKRASRQGRKRRGQIERERERERAILSQIKTTLTQS